MTAWSSLILAVFTYIITIKGELGVVTLKWLPDSFLLAVFGGAFASMIVVLICEISKYWQNRKSTEDYLFFHLYYLYGQLQIISKNIDHLLSLGDKDIPKGALNQLISNAEAEMNAIYHVDFAPVFTDDLVLKEKQKYNIEAFPVIQSFLQSCRMFEIAAITDQIAINEVRIGQLTNKTVNSRYDNKARVLNRLKQLIRDPIVYIDGLESRIDKYCNGRFGWEKMRDTFLDGLPDNQTDALEQFLSEG